MYLFFYSLLEYDAQQYAASERTTHKDERVILIMGVLFPFVYCPFIYKNGKWWVLVVLIEFPDYCILLFCLN